MTKLTKEQFEKYFDDNITVKESKKILGEIAERFEHIVVTINKKIGRRLDWYAFSDGPEGDMGEFDGDKETTQYFGEFGLAKVDTDYEYSFPSRWFYEDFETELKTEIAQILADKKEAEQKSKENKKNLENKMLKMKESIYSKLTDEEKAYVQIVAPSAGKIKQIKGERLVSELVAHFKEHHSSTQNIQDPKDIQKWIGKNMTPELRSQMAEVNSREVFSMAIKSILDTPPVKKIKMK